MTSPPGRGRLATRWQMVIYGVVSSTTTPPMQRPRGVESSGERPPRAAPRRAKRRKIADKEREHPPGKSRIRWTSDRWRHEETTTGPL